MERYRPALGTRIEDLDTPCLLLDLDALEHNFRRVAETYRDTACKMRPHTKNTKSPILAHLQMRIGGTNGGVCTAKVAEAEVMVEGGIEDVLIPNQIVTRDKMDRLCALAKRARMMVAIDNPQNVRELSERARVYGVTIGVVIEVDTSMRRAGVRSTKQAVELARLASSLPGIAFKGVMSHQTLPGSPDRETRFIGGRKYIDICLEAKGAIEAAGFPVEVVSSGETFSYDVAPTIPGVTEVEGGTYALMSHGFDYMTDFQVAGKVLASVISTPRPDVAIGDVGSRALASPGGVLPQVEDMPGVEVEALYEEHIVLRTDGSTRFGVGDVFLLIPGHQDMLVNRWDQYIAVRNGVVEAVWEIPGRGCHN